MSARCSPGGPEPHKLEEGLTGPRTLPQRQRANANALTYADAWSHTNPNAHASHPVPDVPGSDHQQRVGIADRQFDKASGPATFPSAGRPRKVANNQ